MRDPSSIANDLIKTVNAHLLQLAGVAMYQVLEAPLRVASTSLRYLLVEDMLAKAWRATSFGGPMTFRTWRIATFDGHSSVAFCGGEKYSPESPLQYAGMPR